MTTDTKEVSFPHKVEIPRIVTGTAYFLLHFLEMCLPQTLAPFDRRKSST
jgi:hypothetical protein